MDGEIPIMYSDRMQFIVATMTKDYDRARSIANTILAAEPGNITLRNYLSILEKGRNRKKELREVADDDLSESDSEPSVDGTSENTDSNSDNGSDGDSSESAGQTPVMDDENEERDLIDCKRKQFHRGLDPKGSRVVFDAGIKAKTFHNLAKKHNNVGISQAGFGVNDLNGKILRVLPIRLSENISGRKRD